MKEKKKMINPNSLKISKQRINKQRGHLLEEQVYQKIKTTLLPEGNNNYTNIWLKRQTHASKKYTLKKAEIDNLFYYNNYLYIIQCKRKKGIHKGKKPVFWIFNNKLYLNDQEVTEQYLQNLNHTSYYIKEHKIFILHGKPLIRKVLLLDARLEENNKRILFSIVRDTYVITYNFLPTFLNLIKLNKLEKIETTLKQKIEFHRKSRGGRVI